MEHALLEAGWFEADDVGSFLDTELRSIYTGYTISLIEISLVDHPPTSLQDNGEELECVICTETIRVRVQMNNCTHVEVCVKCLKRIFRGSPFKTLCPLCRIEFSEVRRLNC